MSQFTVLLVINLLVVQARACSYAARLPVYVEDPVTARTRVMGVLEMFHEERNEAASKQEPVRWK